MAIRRATVREMTRVSFIIVSPLLFRALNQAQVSLSGPLLRQQRLHVRWSRLLYSGDAPTPARTTCVTAVSLPQKAVRIGPDWSSSHQKRGFVERQDQLFIKNKVVDSDNETNP